MTSTDQPAQNQHYVPKFILRNFLSGQKKEQVHVFSKTARKGFTTAIRNIMAERRFNEFRIDEHYLASFEEDVCRIEDLLLPTYRQVVERGALSNDPAEKALLALLVAFQMLRTRSFRDKYLELEQQLGEALRKTGSSLSDLEGYQPPTEDRLKQSHFQVMRELAVEFATTIGEKDFILLRAAKGRSFYLADNPVALYNDPPKNSLWSNIGLSVRGIQIHLPLSANLMLCAWCPSILEQLREGLAETRRLVSSAILSPHVMAKIDKLEFDKQLVNLRRCQSSIDLRLRSFEEGTALPLESANMDFYNTMQVHNARKFIVCQKGDFDLAARFLRAASPESIGQKLTS